MHKHNKKSKSIRRTKTFNLLDVKEKNDLLEKVNSFDENFNGCTKIEEIIHYIGEKKLNADKNLINNWINIMKKNVIYNYEILCSLTINDINSLNLPLGLVVELRRVIENKNDSDLKYIKQVMCDEWKNINEIKYDTISIGSHNTNNNLTRFFDVFVTEYCKINGKIPNSTLFKKSHELFSLINLVIAYLQIKDYNSMDIYTKKFLIKLHRIALTNEIHGTLLGYDNLHIIISDTFANFNNNNKNNNIKKRWYVYVKKVIKLINKEQIIINKGITTDIFVNNKKCILVLLPNKLELIRKDKKKIINLINISKYDIEEEDKCINISHNNKIFDISFDNNIIKSNILKEILLRIEIINSG